MTTSVFELVELDFMASWDMRTSQDKIKVLEVLLSSQNSIEPINSFTFQQELASSVWTIPHNLNRKPSVTVYDNLNQIIYADVSYVDENTVRIVHGRPIIGSAYLV